MTLSPASIRNVMSDLEHLGLIYAPHTSAGRLPTESGLRLFVDGLLEVGDLTDEERRADRGADRHQARAVARAGADRSRRDDLGPVALRRRGARPTSRSATLKHIEFVQLEPGKALVVLVGEDQDVENRVIDLPAGPAAVEPGRGRQLPQRPHPRPHARRGQGAHREGAQATAKAELDALTQKVIEAGLATWSGRSAASKSLIVRGQANLLKDVDGLENLERIRQLFDDLETKRDLVQLLGLAERGDGVRIFIGSENKLFSLSGSSLIVAPFEDERRKIVGVLGVIGPTRLNYARIIPMVDYTAKLVGRVLT